jgi:glycosyltransferase involved in cell wall biosynthesis
MPDGFDISIAIPVYNGMPFVTQAVESALAQTVPPREVVILDNASTDGTAAALDQFRGNPLVRIERNDATVAGPQNWARIVGKTRGKFFSILGADDRLENIFVERIKSVLDANPSVGFTFCESARVDENDRPLAPQTLPAEMTGRVDPAAFTQRVIDGVFFPNAGVVIERSAYDKLGGFDVRFFAAFDYDFFIRISRVTAVYGVPEILSLTRYHGSQWTKRIFLDDHGDCDLILEKLKSYQLEVGQERQLVKATTAHIHELLTRSVRAPNFTDDAVRARRLELASRLDNWRRQYPDVAAYIPTHPHGLRRRIAWWASGSRMGIRIMRRMLGNRMAPAPARVQNA